MSAPETIDEARRSLLAQLGVRHAHLRALAERLDADFTVESYGYEQFSSLGDIRLRAVVSDQLLRTAHAIVDNLLAAGLHRERLDELVGEGRTMARGVDAAVVLRDSAGIDMALTGFFGALPSALDCLAGVAIAIARLPKSITKADINDLGPLTAKQLAKGTAAQQKTWNDLAALVAAQEAFPPPGWF